jgi:hypothetical protein
MSTMLKRILVGAVAALAMSATIAVTSSPAAARGLGGGSFHSGGSFRGGGGWGGGGWGGAGILGGLALGAELASPDYAYGYGYGYPDYDGGYGACNYPAYDRYGNFIGYSCD